MHHYVGSLLTYGIQHLSSRYLIAIKLKIVLPMPYQLQYWSYIIFILSSIVTVPYLQYWTRWKDWVLTSNYVDGEFSLQGLSAMTNAPILSWKSNHSNCASDMCAGDHNTIKIEHYTYRYTVSSSLYCMKTFRCIDWMKLANNRTTVTFTK